MDFTVIVYEADEGGYWAEVPQLPGCVSQGETLDALRLNITEAIEAVYQAYAEDSPAEIRRSSLTWQLHIPEDVLSA